MKVLSKLTDVLNSVMCLLLVTVMLSLLERWYGI